MMSGSVIPLGRGAQTWHRDVSFHRVGEPKHDVRKCHSCAAKLLLTPHYYKSLADILASKSTTYLTSCGFG